MSSTRYTTTLRTVDEAGQPEEWDIQYRRLTAGNLVAAATIADSDVPAIERIAEVTDLLEKMTMHLTRNGKPVAHADIPFDVMTELYSLHPSFRTESAE